MKKLFTFLFLGLFLFSLASCDFSVKDDKKVITIVQLLSHEALDKATEGIKAGLAEKGFVDGKNVKINVLNPQAKDDLLAQMAEQALLESDLIFCVATPAAQAVKEKALELGSNVPMLFTAVTDGVESGIIPSNEHPGGNISGTSDLNPVKEQVKLFKDLNINEFGFIYSSGEDNSIIQLNLAKKACNDLGLSVREFSVTNAESDLELVLNSITSSGLKGVYIPTDNVMSANVAHIANVLNQAGIVTIAGEEAMVNNGATLTYGSVNYLSLGKATGFMGAKVLEGTKAGDLPVEYSPSTDLFINKSAVESFNLPVPQEFLNKATKTI